MDRQTTGVARRAVRGTSRQGVVPAMAPIEQPLPFPLRGVDADNGREVLNDHLWAFCPERPAAERVQFTRSRPYKKDDNAPVEQKHGPPVRQLVGWERDDTPAALAALNALYADLRLFQNLFQPSMKLGRTGLVGSRLVRRDDHPQTPFERGRACPEADQPKVAALERGLATTDPVARSRRIDQPGERRWALATRATRTPREAAPRPPPPRRQTPGHGWPVSPRAQPQKRVMGRGPRPAGASFRAAHRAIAPDTAKTDAGCSAGSRKTPPIGCGDRVARYDAEMTQRIPRG